MAQISPKCIAFPPPVFGHWAVVLAATVAVAACEPAPPPGDVGTLAVRTPQFSREGVDGCFRCHGGSFNLAIAATPHGDSSNPATPYGQRGCESCHGPGSFHVSRAHGGAGVPAMTTFGHGPGASDRQTQLDACQSCHYPDADGHSRIAFTGSAHDSPYTTCSTCHAMHAVEDPLSDPLHQAQVCLGCHRSQREQHVEVRGKTVDFEKTACSDCHAIHDPESLDEESIFDF